MATPDARLRRILGWAAPPPAWTDADGWARTRDRMLDRLDPSEPDELTASETAAIVDLLAEATPSAASRMTAGEWRDEVDAVTARLLTG
jgi:hypothetical protein